MVNLDAKEIFDYIEARNFKLNPFEIEVIIDIEKNPVICWMKCNEDIKKYEISTSEKKYSYINFSYINYEEYMNMNQENQKVKKIS